MVVAEEPLMPVRSHGQRMEALERANAVRSYRAGLKRRMKRGAVAGVEAIAHPAPELATMKVFDLLLAIPKVGRVKANKTLAACQIAPSKTVGGLSERQRRELLRFLPPLAHVRLADRC